MTAMPTSTARGDLRWMQMAIAQAHEAERIGEVPVGAIVVVDNEAVGLGHNRCIANHDPTAHAEIEAIRYACLATSNYRLSGATLYVTLEPCATCAGAIVHSRITRVVFGTTDPRAGAAGSVMNVLQHAELNHRADVMGGVAQEDCARLLKDFFKRRRR